MKKRLINPLFFTLVVIALSGTIARAQGSPDSKVCKCFATTVPSTFMTGTKAHYGTMGIALSNDLEIKPKQAQPVKFVIPVLASKSTCKSWYSIYITDDQNKKVYESAGAGNEKSYTFPDCNKTYHVQLMAYSKSTAGGDGNCSRRIHITVKPQCNTVVCNCFMEKGVKATTSGDLNINGKVECLPSTATQKRYVLKFDIANKTDCILNVQTISVHGQTIEVPPYNTASKATTPGISLGFSTPLAQARPTGSKLSITVKYTLNGKKCSTTMELPYVACMK